MNHHLPVAVFAPRATLAQLLWGMLFSELSMNTQVILIFRAVNGVRAIYFDKIVRQILIKTT
jgi:hypothetical protein